MRRFILYRADCREYVLRPDKQACPPEYWGMNYWTNSRAKAYVFTQDTFLLACRSWHWLGENNALEKIYLDEETDLVRLLGVEPKRSAR